MVKKVKLFFFRWKIRLAHRDICATHLIPKDWTEVRRGNRWVEVKRCQECLAAATRKAQQFKDQKHWRQEELEDQLRRWRTDLGIKARPEPQEEFLNNVPDEAPPLPQAEGRTIRFLTETLPANPAPEGQVTTWIPPTFHAGQPGVLIPVEEFVENQR